MGATGITLINPGRYLIIWFNSWDYNGGSGTGYFESKLTIAGTDVYDLNYPRIVQANSAYTSAVLTYYYNATSANTVVNFKVYQNSGGTVNCGGGSIARQIGVNIQIVRLA